MAIPGAPAPASGYQAGTIPGGGVLDGPPPSPAPQVGASTGVPLGSMVPPLAAGQMPPEVLTGMLQAAESVSKILDSFAQVTPDLAPDWAAVKTSLLAAMAKVLQAGAGPTSPVAPGPQFPGGGIDRGGGPPALG